MSKGLWKLLFIVMLSSCTSVLENENNTQVLLGADTQDIVKNVVVVQQEENSVEYEYKNVRVDDLAVIAALYCHKQNKKAHLDKVTLYQNHARRAKFVCQ